MHHVRIEIGYIILAIEGDPSVIHSELSTIVRYAREVLAIDDLRIRGYYEPGRIEHSLRHARQVLEARAKLTKELTR